jgi:ribosomal protein S18 acetylase RimI-like enzyme
MLFQALNYTTNGWVLHDWVRMEGRLWLDQNNKWYYRTKIINTHMEPQPMSHASASKPVTPQIRPLQPNDLNRVIEIDQQASGRPRGEFFAKRLQTALSHQGRFIALAVDVDDALQGYAIARLQGGEFGESGMAAVLDVIGVDDAHRHAGFGHNLIDGVVEYLEKREISELRTQVDWQDRGIVGFFAAAGFQLSQHLVLERGAGREETDSSLDSELSDLRVDDSGMADYSDPDGDDFEALSRDKVFVRSMTDADLSAIVRIDEKLTGRNRHEYFEAKLDEALRETGVRVSLVAESDGLAVGYVMARVDFGEYGRAESVAVMDTLGVNPNQPGSGIGSAMLSQLLANLDALRVERVRTRVAWDQFALAGFFKRHGFQPAQQLMLRRG